MTELSTAHAGEALTGQMALVARLGVWPRRMSEDLTAFYVGVSKSKFREQWQAGRWPQPDREGSRLVWDRHVIDRKIDAESGIPQPSQSGMGDTTWDDL